MSAKSGYRQQQADIILFAAVLYASVYVLDHAQVKLKVLQVTIVWNQSAVIISF